MDLSERKVKKGQQEEEEEEEERREEEKTQESQPDQGLNLSLANGGSNRSGMLPMSTPSANPAQLTIFFGGSVCVYDSVAPEKAQAIMLIAAAAAAAAATTKSNTVTVAKPPMTPAATVAQAGVSPVLTRSLSLQSTSVATGQPQVVPDPSSICKLQADLPIARRHSLQRFLEKRRDRIVSKAPYSPAKSSEGMDGMEVAAEGKAQ